MVTEAEHEEAARLLMHQRGCPGTGDVTGHTYLDPTTGELRGSHVEHFTADRQEDLTVFEIPVWRCAKCGASHYGEPTPRSTLPNEYLGIARRAP